MPITKTHANQVKRRRSVEQVNPLVQLPEHIQKAYCQEDLDQAALFRAIAAASNGVPGPIYRNIIPDLKIAEALAVDQEHVNESSSAPEPDPPLTPEPEPDLPPTPEPDPPPPVPLPEPKPIPLPEAQPLPDIQNTVTVEQLQKAVANVKGRGRRNVAAGILGTGILASLIYIAMPALLGSKPTVPTTPEPPVVDTDAQLLEVLGQSGYLLPSTGLSDAANRVYNYDPSLREKHLKEVEDTFYVDP
jgi:hypothetical protein